MKPWLKKTLLGTLGIGMVFAATDTVVKSEAEMKGEAETFEEQVFTDIAVEQDAYYKTNGEYEQKPIEKSSIYSTRVDQFSGREKGYSIVTYFEKDGYLIRKIESTDPQKSTDWIKSELPPLR